MSKFKTMKFRVNNPEHSKIVQYILFGLGYSWPAHYGQTIQDTDKPFLTTDMNGTIRYCERTDFFDTREGKEIDVDWLEVDAESNETIEINGKLYYKSDVEERLSELEPVEE